MSSDHSNEGPMTGGANPAQAAMAKAVDATAANVRAALGAGAGMPRTAADGGTGGMAEFSRMFADMKLPAMPDVEAMLAVQRRNMEVLSNANRVALEGAQAVARRHMEMVQQTMSDMTDGMRQLASPESPQARAAKQAEMLKQGYERAVAHMRELADLIQQSNGEALGLLNQRFAEAMDEVKQLASKSAQPPG